MNSVIIHLTPSSQVISESETTSWRGLSWGHSDNYWRSLLILDYLLAFLTTPLTHPNHIHERSFQNFCLTVDFNFTKLVLGTHILGFYIWGWATEVEGGRKGRMGDGNGEHFFPSPSQVRGSVCVFKEWHQSLSFFKSTKIPCFGSL